MEIRRIIFMLIVFPLFIEATLNNNVIRFVGDYYKYQKIRLITTFTCSKHDTITLTKSLMSTEKFLMVSSDPEQPIRNAIDPIIKRSYHKFGIFMDYDCPAGKIYLQENSIRRSLNGSYYWLIWSKEKYTSDIKDLNLHIDTEMTWAYPEASSDQIILYDLYKINYSWPINGTLAGHWNLDTGLNYNLTQYKYSRRQDMRGIVLRGGLVVNAMTMENLEEELLKPENKKLDAMGTYNYKLFLVLMQQYNFSVTIVPSRLFGYVIENGKMEGLTQMLVNHEIDLSISAILFNRGRVILMDFVSVPTWEFRVTALFRHPPVTGTYGEVLLTPFEMNVWTSSAGMWLIVILTIRFVSWVETNTFDFEPTSHEQETVRSWSDSLMIIIGAISEQGTTMDSKWVAWRTAFLAAFILSMMVNINYSASLVSSLLNTPPKTIHTTKDLTESSLEFGAEDISYSMPYFELNKDPVVHELFMKKMAPPHQGYYSRDVGLAKMEKERFVFHTEVLNVYPQIENTFTDKMKCDLTEVSVIPPEKCYLVIPWGTPYKELVTIGLRKAYERGLVNYQDRIWRIPKPACAIKEEFVSVDMEKISPAFLIVVIGIILALMVLLGEKIAKRREMAALNIEDIIQVEKQSLASCLRRKNNEQKIEIIDPHLTSRKEKQDLNIQHEMHRTKERDIPAKNIHYESTGPRYTTARPWIY